MNYGKRIDCNVNPGGHGEKDSEPFVTISQPWSPQGYFSLTWLTTPAELRRLADELEAANKAHAESLEEAVA